MLPLMLFTAVGILLMLLSVPLILRKVPRNDWYGLRTQKTMHGSEQEWYDANHDAGVGVCVVGFLTLAAGLLGMLLSHRTLLAESIAAGVLVGSLMAEFFRIRRRHGTR